jgi:hypothetical protein
MMLQHNEITGISLGSIPVNVSKAVYEEPPPNPTEA